jgi:putative DNA primase/helicase
VSLTVDDVKADVIAFCREYPAAASLAYKIRDTQQELFGVQATVERYGILTAAYFPRSRRVDIAASAFRDHEEVARTLRHEVLGHYALNTFQPAHKRAILDAIGATRGNPAFAQTWSDVDTNYPGRSEIGKAEEVYCAFAEYAAAGRASSNGQTALEQTCFSKQRPMTDRDLAAIVDHVADGLHRNTRRQQTFPATDAEQFRSAERTNDIKASTYDERVADHRETIRARRQQETQRQDRGMSWRR